MFRNYTSIKVTTHIVVSFFLLYPSFSFGQSPNLNHEKYWYYRYRLINDFLKVGSCQGCSMPMNQRGLYTVFSASDASPNPPHTQLSGLAKWGDGTIALGNYISILATEYYLLSSHGQNTDQTVEELYYALTAFNRLDSLAEPLYRFRKNGTMTSEADDLNGFFIRDDVPFGFLANNSAHFNSGKIKYRDASNNLVTPPLLYEETGDWVSVHEQDSYPLNPLIGLDPTLESDSDDVDGTNYAKANAVSQDQIWPIYTGLALTTNFIPNSLTYNSLPFQDGTTSIRQEAINIMNRIRTWYQSHGFLIRNPVYDNELVKLGSSVLQYQYGAAKASCYIRYPNNLSEPKYPLLCAPYGTIPSPFYALWQLLPPSVGFVTSEGHKVMQLSAVGNSLYLGVLNTTNAVISPICVNKNWYYLPLLRQVLHGGGNWVNEDTYIELLNDAPCEGPYNFGYPDFAPNLNYSTNDLLHDPERRGETGTTDNIENYHGAFSGIDYMLYHNLYYIVREEDYSSPTNLITRNVSGVLPIFLNIPTLSFSGTLIAPATIKAFETLNLTSIVTPSLYGGYSPGNPTNTKIDFRAGTQINIKPGHHAIAGADLHYVIKPFDCASDGEYRAPTSADSNTISNINSRPYYASLEENTDQNGEMYLSEIGYHYYYDSRDENPLTEEEEELMQDTTALIESAETGVAIYPNPSAGNFNLTVSLPAGPCNIKIFDSKGSIVFSEDVDLSEQLTHEINISTESPGIYLLKLQSKVLGAEIIRRIQKQ